MRTDADQATAKFCEGYNCAQSVLYAYCEALHLNCDTVLRLACGFGAGMGRSQEVCGAVSGGILVLGFRHGRGVGDERPSTEVTYAKTRALMERFRQRHGTYICRELLKGCDLTTAEGQDSYTDRDFQNLVCIPCIQSVITILDELK